MVTVLQFQNATTEKGFASAADHSQVVDSIVYRLLCCFGKQPFNLLYLKYFSFSLKHADFFPPVKFVWERDTVLKYLNTCVENMILT